LNEEADESGESTHASPLQQEVEQEPKDMRGEKCKEAENEEAKNEGEEKEKSNATLDM
ncbi:hypothetical protein KI387_041362, partial [Taxus chinensis]